MVVKMALNSIMKFNNFQLTRYLKQKKKDVVSFIIQYKFIPKNSNNKRKFKKKYRMLPI